MAPLARLTRRPLPFQLLALLHCGHGAALGSTGLEALRGCGESGAGRRPGAALLCLSDSSRFPFQSVAGASWVSELLWTFFVPVTVYQVRYYSSLIFVGCGLRDPFGSRLGNPSTWRTARKWRSVAEILRASRSPLKVAAICVQTSRGDPGRVCRASSRGRNGSGVGRGVLRRSGNLSLALCSLQLLALELGVVSTCLTAADKAEHLKRLHHHLPASRPPPGESLPLWVSSSVCWNRSWTFSTLWEEAAGQDLPRRVPGSA